MSDFFVVAVWLILRKCCHFKRMHWSSALILYIQPAMSAIGYLPRRAFWQNFCVNLSIQTQYIRESFIFACVLRRGFALLMSARTNLLTARVSSRPLALKCLNWQSLHEFSLNTDINVCCSGLGWWRNKCSYSSIRHSHWTRVNGLSTFFFIAVIVMYWEARMRIH